MGCAQSSIPTRDIDNNDIMKNIKSPRLVSAIASPTGSPTRKTVRINTSANTTTTFEKASFCTYKPSELMFELYLDSTIEKVEESHVVPAAVNHDKYITVEPKADIEEPIIIAPLVVSDDDEECEEEAAAIISNSKKATSRSQSRDSSKSEASTPGVSNNNIMDAVAVVADQQDNTTAPTTDNATTTTTPVPVVEEEKEEECIKQEEEEEQQQQEEEETTNTKQEGETVEEPVQPRMSNGRRVAFDKETLARTAPITIANNNTINNNSNGKNNNNKGGKKTKLTRKQKELLKKGQVSTGRYGPVTSKACRSKGQMQADVYMEMAAAFERLLTNASTINAHLDTQ